MESFRHVIQYFNQYTFKLTINGERVIPEAWWVTRGQTSFFAELSKWYYREKYLLDHHTVRISPGVTLDQLTAHATTLGIDMSHPDQVYPHLPKGIRGHIERNREALEDFAAINLNTDFQRGVSSASSHLRIVITDLRQAAGKTSGPQKEFLDLAIQHFEGVAADFAASAVRASKKPLTQ